MEQMAAARQQKIERYRARKALEKKQEVVVDVMAQKVVPLLCHHWLQELSAVLSNVEPGQKADEDVVRQHTLTLVRIWICKAQESLDSIGQEVELLQRFERARMDPPPARKADPLPVSGREGFKPFVITKDMLKVGRMPKAWFGKVL